MLPILPYVCFIFFLVLWASTCHETSGPATVAIFFVLFFLVLWASTLSQANLITKADVYHKEKLQWFGGLIFDSRLKCSCAKGWTYPVTCTHQMMICMGSSIKMFPKDHYEKYCVYAQIAISHILNSLYASRNATSTPWAITGTWFST